MKKGLVLTLGMLLALNAIGQNDPVLMQINDKKITKSEFLQVYLKNNPNPQYDQKSLDDYMELYRKFQLKVAEAENKKYDTIPKLKRELEGYQRQLAQPYLTDRQMNEYLVKEAYDRMQKEVRASHILISIDPTADTLKSYQKAMDVRSRLLKGEEFTKVAAISADPSAQVNGGDLGFFTVFQMVYQFEDAVYGMKVGDVSMPIRTKFGYHIVKKTDERPARGTMKAAHILISAHKDVASAQDIEIARNKANEIYQKIQNGESFEALVRAYSDDHSSVSNNGVLPTFGSGATTRLVTEFEDAAFAIQNDGQVSAPIQTTFGFHIIKRIEHTPLRSYDDLKKDLENRVNRDDRAKKTQKSYVTKLKTEFGYVDLTSKTLKPIVKVMDSSIYRASFETKAFDKKNKTVFRLDAKDYTQKDLIEYMNNNGRVFRNTPLKDLPTAAIDRWTSELVIEKEKSLLDKKYPEYRALMTEYHDGILLYEIMSDEVWNKAISDSTGLVNFYEANKNNYRWDKRYDIVAYEITDAKLAAQTEALLKKGLSQDSITRVINKDSELNLRVKSGKLEEGKTPYLKDRVVTKGINAPFAFNDKYYVLDVKEILAPATKELTEAKGLITSDFQNFLEKEWLKELESKHKVEINKDVLYSIGK